MGRAMIRAVNTPDGLVVRVQFPGGEHAYRLNNDGRFAFAPDHSNLWVGTDWMQIPERVRDAFKHGVAL